MWIVSSLASVLPLLAATALPIVQVGDRARAFAPRKYSLILSPKTIECADLNSDGRPDLLWSLYGFSYVYRSLGLPGGDLGPPISTYAWPTFPSPPQFAPAVLAPIAADLDSDGVMDIVCAYEGVWNVGWLRGNGSGGFATPQVFYSALASMDPDLHVADLNGDLLPDVIMADGTFDKVVWIPGTGGGALGTPVILWTGNQPNAICVQDLDGDGDKDVAIALGTLDAITVLANNGQAIFTQTQVLPSGSRPLAIACGDFDANGHVDLACSDSNGGTVSVHFATALGGYLPRVVLTAGGVPRTLAAEDIDQDGFVDLVAGTGTGNYAGDVRLWRSLGAQMFSSPVRIIPSVGASRVRIFDMDQDGARDVIAIDGSRPEFTIAFGGAPGVFHPAALTTLPGMPSGLDLADFDENGRLDVLVTEYLAGMNTVRVLRGNGQGGLSQLGSQLASGDPIATIAGDFDGDGHRDALIVDRPSGHVLLARGDGTGNLLPTQIAATTAVSAACAAATDLDHDGKLDVLVGVPAPARIVVLKGQGGGSFAPGVFIAVPGVCSSFSFADINEDGSVDVLAECWPYPQFAFGDGQGGLGAWQGAPMGYGPHAIGLGDLNEDGHVDLFWADDNSMRWCFGAGNGTFGSAGMVAHSLEGASSIRAVDLDCDGHVDLALGAETLGVFHGNGHGAFSAPLIFGTGRGWQLALGDMNGDGRIDAVSADRPSLAVSVQLNRGPSCPPSTYCLAKVNSLGCTPTIGFAGTPSASASSGFVVDCAQVRNNKNGLLFYGFTGAQQIPFLGGVRCVSTPIRRGIVVNAGGNPAPADDCSGVLSMDWNSFSHGALGGNPSPGASALGAEIHSQWWARDQGFAPPNNHSLSNGLRFSIGP